MNIRMFDEYNIKVKITIDDEEMNLKLITQPYVIKSRISDLSYSIDMLNGDTYTKRIGRIVRRWFNFTLKITNGASSNVKNQSMNFLIHYI